MERKLTPFSNEHISNWENFQWKSGCYFGLFMSAFRNINTNTYKAFKVSLILQGIAPPLTSLGFFLLSPYSAFRRFGITLSLMVPFAHMLLQCMMCTKRQALELSEDGQDIRYYLERLSLVNEKIASYHNISMEYAALIANANNKK